MSFFTLSDGKKAESKTTFEIEGGGGEPIPANSILLAMVTEAKWDEYEGVRYINLRWDVVGKEYTKRVIFQKLKVHEEDPKKRDRQVMMLMAIDANSGGNLYKLDREPTDEDLAHLCNKKMGIQVEVWKLKDKETGEDKTGNWIKLVSDAKNAAAMLKEMGGNPKPETKKPEPKKEEPFGYDIDDDDAPF